MRPGSTDLAMASSPPDQPEPQAHDGFTVVEDVTCTACGCLCDDLTLVVADGRIVEARKACEPGRRWFLDDRPNEGLPVAAIEGSDADRDKAIARAAEILGRARAPIVLGLTRTTTETVAAALALADRIGAVVDLAADGVAPARLRAVQRMGRVSATLGEVKNRADVVVFWGADPVVTHPRHWDRYSVEPRGRFVPEGRAGRTVMVADRERTATAERADRFLAVAPEMEFATLWVLRALVRGVPLDPSRVERSTGIALATLNDWAEGLKRARYGAWFVAARFGADPRGTAESEAALALVSDLNASARFVFLTLGGPGNPSGADAVMTWQTGFASGVDLSQGSPRELTGASGAAAMLASGEADAALIVADDVESSLTAAALAQLARIPLVVIAPGATRPGRRASVALASAISGIEAPGTVTRSDGVVLPLRPPLAATVPTDREWLRAIADRIEAAERSA